MEEYKVIEIKSFKFSGRKNILYTKFNRVQLDTSSERIHLMARFCRPSSLSDLEMVVGRQIINQLLIKQQFPDGLVVCLNVFL